MQDEVAVAVTPSQPVKEETAPTPVSRSLSALSTLSISEFASAAKSEPQQQQPEKSVAKKKKKRKATKTKSADGAAVAPAASGGGAVSGDSKNSSGGSSNQATPKRKAATTKSNNNGNNSKTKTTDNSLNNASEKNGVPAFVPAHMPVWLPDIAHVNDSSAPITERYVRCRVTLLSQVVCFAY